VSDTENPGMDVCPRCGQLVAILDVPRVGLCYATHIDSDPREMAHQWVPVFVCKVGENVKTARYPQTPEQWAAARLELRSRHS
jgi:hypothetical protein